VDRIYLDHNASTPVAPEVLEAMLPWLGAAAGNPSSVHASGRAALAALQAARGQVMAALGVRAGTLVFTSGGTEADNLALLGCAEPAPAAGQHVICSAVEHPAVLEACRSLQAAGWALDLLPVDFEGRVSAAELSRLLRPETRVVSVMVANNDLGTLQPIAELAEVCRARGVLLHCDAVQALGKVPLRCEDWGVDMVSVSAHKVYGPKGTGALWLRPGLRVRPQIVGGAHESGLRAGTQGVPGIVGFGAACALGTRLLEAEAQRQGALRDRLEAALLARLPWAQRNGHLSERVANTANLSFPGLPGDLLQLHLDAMGVELSTGSACSAGKSEPSHVLLALGRSRALASSALRFSLGRASNADQIDRCVAAVVAAVQALGGPPAEATP